MAEKRLKRELIKKEDGRYLYLYTWAEEEKKKNKAEKNSRAPEKRAQK